jgi:hypothetical protein
LSGNNRQNPEETKMTIVRTSESLVRQLEFTFRETVKRDDLETDIYATEKGTEIHAQYDANGMPVVMTIKAPHHGVENFIVCDESQVALDPDRMEALLHEKIDGEQYVFRMSGLEENEALPDPA